MNPENTRDDSFYPVMDQEIKVPTMHQTSTLNYFKDDTIEAVKLAFTNGAEAEFVMGLPSNVEISENYSYDKTRISLSLPKFSHEETIDLIPVCKESGLADLFTAGSLGKMVNDPTAYISAFVQKIYTSFDEEGAEVRAVTYGVAMAMASMPMKSITVQFNKPFHYRITKNESTLVQGFFTGK